MARYNELIRAAKNVAEKVPSTTPGAMALTMGHNTPPLAWCARVLDIDVITIDAIEVPSAKCTTYCGAIPCAKNMLVSIGTIIPPPPMPSSPAINPAKSPKDTNANTHSISIFYCLNVVNFCDANRYGYATVAMRLYSSFVVGKSLENKYKLAVF